MTTLPQDVEADLRRRILELEQRLDSTIALRDEAVERQTATALVNFRLQNELRAIGDRRNASTEILRTIANTSGDAEHALQRIAETTARFFNASSVTIRITDGTQWIRTIAVGNSSERIAVAVPISQLAIGGKNLPGTVYRENRQIHIPNLDNVDPAFADFPGIAPARAGGTRTMSGTPLRRGNGAIGALIIHRDRLAPFTTEELALQQSFADQAVIAIENARLFNETQEALQRQTATSDILRVIASSPSDVQPVFEAIAQRSNRLLGGLSTAVFSLVDNVQYLMAFTPTNPEADAALKSMFPRLASEVFWGEAIQKGEIFRIADAEVELETLPSMREIARLRGWRSALLVPLLRDDKAIGLISVTRAEPGPFADHHVQLLKTFADQAVIAIENVRLFNETREALERQTATADILKVIASSPSDVQPVFDAIVGSAAKLFEPCAATITMVKDGKLHWNATAALLPGYDVEGTKTIYPIPFDPNRSPSARAILERRVIEIPDTEAPDTPEFTRRAAVAGGFRAITYVPLIEQDQGIGTIIFAHPQPGFKFSDKQLALVQTFADQAVIAIQNAHLFNETKEALERQTATADILKVIAGSPSDTQPVFNAIANSAQRLLGGLSSTVFLFIDGMAHLGAFTPTTPEADEFLRSTFPRPAADFGPIEMTQRGDVVQVSDTEDLTDQIKYVARARGYRSMVFAPLMNKGAAMGFIAVTRAQPSSFTDHHVQLLKTFADQAVIAIENTKLFEQVQAKTRDLEESLERQTATADVLKVISRSTFDLKTVLQTLVESAARLCGADAAQITRQQDGVFFRAEAYGFSEKFIEYTRRTPVAADRGSGIGRALLEGKAVHVPDVLADPEYTYTEARQFTDYRAVLAVPMLREGAPIGVIIMTRKQARPFTEKQIELATTFADQAAIAIGNVQLFDEVQARTSELAKSLEDLRAAQDRLIQTEKLASLGQLTAGIAHEIKNPLNFVNNFSALSVELTDELNGVLKQATLAEEIRAEVDELTGTLKDNLGKVVQHGKRADSIVKNMLLHSREGSGEHRPADVNALVDESLNLAYHGARAEKPHFNVTLERDFDPAAGSADVFPQEITRVLLNLISNGFYAVTKRKVENAAAGFEPTVRASTLSRGDHVEIRIRDNGTGIPQHVREKMFNPFFTTKPAGEGTGLGLSMSHDIVVKQHGGSIEVETEPGAFTEFRIVLPRASIISGKTGGTG